MDDDEAFMTGIKLLLEEKTGEGWYWCAGILHPDRTDPGQGFAVFLNNGFLIGNCEHDSFQACPADPSFSPEAFAERVAAALRQNCG